MNLFSRSCLVVTLSLGSLATIAAQPGGAPQTPPETNPRLSISEKSVRLTGCIQMADTTDKRLTLSDRKRGIRYFLSGKDVSAYVGRRVRIVGGLIPTPNVAAQAGAIDQAAAANERIGRSRGTGDVRVEELLVASVNPLKGSCRP